MKSVNRLINTFVPENYKLHLNLSRKARVFDGTVQISGTVKQAGGVKLHAKDLNIHTIMANGTACTWQLLENDEISIATDATSGSNIVIDIGFSGTISDAMHGLYPCYFEVDGVKKELLATQFESHHAREVFPCIDEPEAKATFDLTLTTEPGIVVLSNMPVKTQSEENGLLETTFEQTPRMSSYLVAFVAGELQKKTARTTSGVEVNVYATHAQTTASLDFALEHATRTIEFFDEYFDTAYPLPKSDHVALPDFSSGAMENWGLVTYREIALLADPATTTLASKRYIATVVSHELSHQWFGNLVTMRWWNDLWLNESFATIMEYLAVDAIHPEWNVWSDFSANETILALRRDAIEGVQPVRVAVHHPDEINTLFDGAIVYAKGARLLKMCRDFIGEKNFQNGLKDYFQKFAYDNTSASDLWDCLGDTSGIDVSSFMDPWLNQSGYPVLEVSAGKLSQQQFFIGPNNGSTKLWPIPLAASSSEDVPALLETKELAVEIADDERFNIHDSGHYLTKYSSEHLTRLLADVTTLNEIGRMQLLDEQTMLARGGYVASASLIDILPYYKNETTDSVWVIIAAAISELKKFVENDAAAEQKLRKLAGELATPLFTKLGWQEQPNESENDTKLRSIILAQMIYSEDPDILAHCKELYAAGIENVNPEQRSLVIGAVVRHSADPKLVPALFDTYRASQSADLREDICVGLTCARSASDIATILANFTDKATTRPQDLFRWFGYIIRNRYARDAAMQWMIDNWPYIEANFAGDKSYDDFPRYAAMGLVTREQLHRYRDFFEPMQQDPSLKRNIDVGILEIEGRVELIERDSPGVIAQLTAAGK